MLMLILSLVLIFGVAWGCIILVDKAGVPAPFNMLLKVVIVIVAVYCLLLKAGMLQGTGL